MRSRTETKQIPRLKMNHEFFEDRIEDIRFHKIDTI